MAANSILDFGVPLPNGSFVVQAKWQSAFNLGVPVGQVVGSFGVGYPLAKIGRRWTLGACCTISLIAIAIQSSAQNRPQLLVAELVNGVVLGAYPVIAPTYISEVTPVVVRGIASAFVNLSFVVGQLVASGVLAGCQARGDRWAYGIPFLTQFIFPVVILCLLPFCPESPWWLVRRGEMEKAEKALKALTHSSVDTTPLLAHIQLTTSLEDMETETDRFVDCFKKTDLRRTIISIMVYAIQPIIGNFLVIGAQFTSFSWLASNLRVPSTWASGCSELDLSEPACPVGVGGEIPFLSRTVSGESSPSRNILY